MLLRYPILVITMVVTVEVAGVLMMSCIRYRGRVRSVETLASRRWWLFRRLRSSRTPLMRMRRSDVFHKPRLIAKVSFASVECAGNTEGIPVASEKMTRYHSTKCTKLNFKLSATELDGGNTGTST